jgi:hypothetical protein
MPGSRPGVETRGYRGWGKGRFSESVKTIKPPPCIAQIDQAGSLLGLRYVELSDVRYWVNSGRHIFNSSSSGFDSERTLEKKEARTIPSTSPKKLS